MLPCRTHLPRIARATDSCTPRELTNARSALVGVAETGQGLEGGRRESSLLTFAALFVTKKREKRKEFLVFFKKDTSSVSLWLTPSPTGEGWRKSLLSSAHKLNSRPPIFICGRAGNACTNLLGFFVRYVRTRGMVKVAEDSKSANFAFILYRTHSPRMARATNSCTPPVVVRRTARVLLADFCRAFGHSKAR